MISRREYRLGIIRVLYAYELMDQPLNIQEIFENNPTLNEEQIKHIEQLSRGYENYKNVIKRFIHEKWSWERTSPLIRAILLNASYELLTIKIPRIVINEAIEITKYFFEDEKNYYKMVNAILQNIYKYFVINEYLVINENNNQNPNKKAEE
ncbi:transcription antitermination protein NusB [Mycoplasmopsis opalescens]|uniref:transcription antitermination protein NusB n=1 Tax=Mycoplasmopsis opalescens TaxID=114886 RepID=UPI0004A6C7ED|nr:transcription antitermination protein NusB [Mycoplasmopsis opalescens]